MEKKRFDFYQDVKVTVWQRQHFTIEAETAEEARELAKQYADKDISCCDEVEADEIEWLYDTEEQITPEENNGCATIEVYEPEGKYKGKLIADNALKEEEERKLIGYQIDFGEHEWPKGLFSFQVFRAEQDAKDYINETGNKGNIVPIFDGDIEEPSFLGKKPRTFKQGERVVVCTDYGNYQAVVVHDMYVDYEDDLIKIHVLRNEEDDDSSGISTESIEASDVYQYANGKVCPRCGGPLCIEHHDKIDYPYFCPSCDENFYGIEVQ